MKSHSFKEYIVNRLGRLYSVMLPALITSFLIAISISMGNYAISNRIENMSNLPLRFILNNLFLSQSLTICANPPLNNAFWSVQYEFYFYFFLGFLLFLKGWKRIFFFEYPVYFKFI